MGRNYHRRRIVFLVWLVIVLLFSAISFNSCRKKKPASNVPAKLKASKEVNEMSRPLLTVEDGDVNTAFTYYKETFVELGLMSPPSPGTTDEQAVTAQNFSLSSMLKFLGYDGLKPSELEDLSSDELMNKPFPPDSILASAFFAPKITDVTENPINVGWRKIVRLKALGNDAKGKGVASGFFLFNKFQGPDHSKPPFRPGDISNESKNTQLILVRSDSSGLSRSLYFFMFEGIIENGGKLKTFLKATFDARDPNVVPGGKYYVPEACAQCHGGIERIDNKPVPLWEKLKLNYLDTDHWFDRTNDGDDFAFLQDHPYGVVFDGGKDETSDAFRKAFQRLRQLNIEIEAQNKKDETSFQYRAVNHWLFLHGRDVTGNVRHQDIFARALPPIPAGAKSWNATDSIDKELLPLLNQYCVRCHSSVIYNVFDRPEVVRRKTKIRLYLNIPDTDITNPLRMPQDRKLDNSVKQKIIDLLNRITPTPTP